MRTNSAAAIVAFPEVSLRCGARGRCQACYAKEYRALWRKTRAYNDHEAVLDEYAHFSRDTGITRTGLARALKISVQALDKHLRDARKNGDPRARRTMPL